ncbi:flavoprotein oxygenase [Verticillium alfalfae VaMs.102]|uniref:Flavoprotein oxygenase n=1 Tax=Verticillium alfalfae (strain VaMs.102 / ATCC MYA-4576 / FGSC 10136) TaxID=526221 RepID=C9SED2_VERA1|nr:flavoprotein oxygenase [Verticillium alfalfae VaMs.102]EEY16525.1 flavoprotein oxygenase [Verticillium alfalfae VaMs.102]
MSSDKLPEAAPRNPHGDFKAVEAARPDFDSSASFHYTKTPAPGWQYGDGANTSSSASHVAIDPHAAGRPAGFNYKFLISAITPRPIAFLSTRARDGSENLAPFSYFNMINHDPPLFSVGFSSGLAAPKDSLRNLVETERVVINIISEPFLEAANATSINAPHGVSEWHVAGLTPLRDTDNGVARVGEAVVAIEGTLVFTKEWASRATPRQDVGHPRRHRGHQSSGPAPTPFNEGGEPRRRQRPAVRGPAFGRHPPNSRTLAAIRADEGPTLTRRWGGEAYEKVQGRGQGAVRPLRARGVDRLYPL